MPFATTCSQVALVVKNLPANAGDIRNMGLIPGSERSPGGGHGNPLQCSCLENPMDKGAWRAAVHRITKSQTQLKQLGMHTHTSFNTAQFQVTVDDQLRQHSNMTCPACLSHLHASLTFTSVGPASRTLAIFPPPTSVKYFLLYQSGWLRWGVVTN